MEYKSLTMLIFNLFAIILFFVLLLVITYYVFFAEKVEVYKEQKQRREIELKKYAEEIIELSENGKNKHSLDFAIGQFQKILLTEVKLFRWK